MPPPKLHVSVVTPIRQVARIEVDMVTAPSVMGEVGILPDHRPLLADLKEGTVSLSVGGRADVFAVSGGFIEVDRNQVTILAETAEAAGDIDVDRARRSLKQAEKDIAKQAPGSDQYERLAARIRRAKLRLEVARAS